MNEMKIVFDRKEGYEYRSLIVKVLKSGELSKKSNKLLERALGSGWQFVRGIPRNTINEILLERSNYIRKDKS
jgi:hypothetical protein